MKPGQPLSLSTRRKLTEELYQQYIAWGDEALSNGNRPWSHYYYHLAERCLHLIHSPHLEAMHRIATSSFKEGASSSQKPNLRVIQGGKPFLSIPQPVKPSSPTPPVLPIMGFERPSATYGNYPTQIFGESK